MAIKTFRFPVTVGVVDPDKSVGQLLDKDGRLVRPASVGIKHVAPGEPVEMEEAEGRALILRHGVYKKTVVVTETEAAPVVPAVASVPAARRA